MYDDDFVLGVYLLLFLAVVIGMSCVLMNVDETEREKTDLDGYKNCYVETEKTRSWGDVVDEKKTTFCEVETETTAK